MNASNEERRKSIALWLSLGRKQLLDTLGRQEGISGSQSSTTINHQTGSIFLSYARPDQRRVSDLYDALLAEGFRPWMDLRDILPGEDWLRCITLAIRSSEFFIACISRHSVSRRGILQKELHLALDILEEMLDDDIYLIPVRLEDCIVPEALRQLQWVDLFTEHGYNRLVAAIRQGTMKRLQV